MGGHPLPGSIPRPTTPYDDVRDAWRAYLQQENHGRGVVLIGHSQGAGILVQLIKNEIDGKPAQGRLVSALLLGTNLGVPKGADVGGDFKSIRLCRSPSQTGCAVAYASFLDDSPPPANSRFGRPREPGSPLAAACVNPANLSGAEGELHSYLATGSQRITPGGSGAVEWVKGKTIDTPFVTLPGLLTARCVSTTEFNYLAIHIKSDEPGPRTKVIPGDIALGGQILKDWGLHLIDVNLAMGNLVDLVGEQGRAWVAKHP